MRNVHSALLAALVTAICCQAHAQIAKPSVVTPQTTAPNAETPIFEVYQAIFVLLFSRPDLLTSEEGKASAAARLEAIGLDSKAAKSLAAYVSAGLAEQRDFSEMKIVELCRRKSTFSSKGQLGDAFAAIYEGLDRMQARSWGSFDFLDRKNRAILSSYAAKRRLEIPLRGNNPRAAIDRSPETLQQFLGRICAGK
jgi:hypothetical protein